MLKIVEEIWNHHLDENDRLEFDISSLHLSLKYLQNFLYRGIIIILCLRHLLWNQHQAMIVAYHLYSVRIRYQYVYHLHYCSKDCHHYNSCCHWYYFRGDCFCCCYCHWDCVWQPKACNFLKKRLWHRCFPVNFVQFLRIPFFTERLWASKIIQIDIRDTDSYLDLLFQAIAPHSNLLYNNDSHKKSLSRL